MAASSSSSSAPPPPIQQRGYGYEVFLSFRGEDTRKTFTDHLYTDLVDKGIRTFRDDDELPKGESIKPEILKAINKSKVSVPILSKGYASSKWCLMELAQMVKCMEAGNQKILPIFYHVEPRELRHRKREYAEAFSEHEKEHCSTVVEEWRTALETVGKLKGWYLENNGYEGSLRSKVVLEVFKELKKYHHIDITDSVVGIDDHVDEIMDCLDINIADVRVGGIWGMAGSGKTTIAKFIYNQLMHKFDYCSFLGDISELSISKGKEFLQAQLASDILGHRSAEIFDVGKRKFFLEHMFWDKKVLIVLDGVDQAEQLNPLLPFISSVSAGSRIIITTRNRDVLEVEAKKVDWLYEIKEMDEDSALLLFCKHAFKQDFVLPEYDNLSREIVKAIGGIPLAIEVVASYLSRHLENKAVWGEELRRLKRDPKIQEKLRVSIDSLSHEEREIFLDIACLFNGMDCRIPVSMWSALKLDPEETVNNLLAKSLIKLTEGSKLWMHNLLRDLGREAVRAENRNEPGERSRLWRSEDGIQVLDYEEGTAKVQAICLACDPELEHRRFSGEDFKELSRLLFLDLGFANLNGGFEKRLRRLKWFSWHGIGQNQLSLPSEFHLRDLIVLDLSESSIGESWGGWNLIQDAKKLEVLNLKSCQQLRSTPHFNSFLPLKRLILEDCHELSVVHSSIGQLTALESLNLKNCWSLQRLPDELGSLLVLTELVIDKVPIESLPDGMANLETLSAKSCELLKELSLSDYESLKKVNLSHTPVVQFSFSSRQPRNLQVFDISYSSVCTFPPSLMELQTLEVINASACHSLEGGLPTELARLTSLRILRLDNTKITSIPEGIMDLCRLEVLDLGNSKCEKTLPELPSSLCSLRVTSRYSKTVVPNLSDLINLRELEFTQCSKLDELPEEIRRLSKLRRLKLHLTNIVALPKEMAELCQLRELNISNCYRFESLPELPSGLRRLSISRCSSLRRLPELSSLEKLRTFSLIECRNIVEIPNLGELKSLRRLRIRAPLATIHGLEMLSSLVHLSLRACAIRKIEGIHSLCSLKKLTIMNCETLQEVDGIEGLVSLEELWIYQCPALENFPNLSVMRNLKVLNLQILENLVEVQGLVELVSLETLVISRCNGVETIPNLSRLQQLKTLQLHGLEKLVEIKGLSEFLSLEMLVVSLCYALETLPSLSLLQKLKTLKLRGLIHVMEIQGLSGLVSLESLAISHCEEIVALPGLSMMQKLRELALHSCGKLSDIQGIAELVMLESLVILCCEQINILTDIPELPNLKTRELEHEHDIGDELLTQQEFTSLELHSPEITAESLHRSIYGMAFLDNLTTHYGAVDQSDLELNVQKLFKLIGFKKSEISWSTEISEFEWLEKLFVFGDCLKALPDLSRLQKLKKLELRFCKKLEFRFCKKLNDIHGLDELKSLEELLIVACYALDALPDLSRLHKVKKAELNFCDKLHGLSESESLEELLIESCDAVDALPNLSRLYKLKKLKLIYCEKLKDIHGLSELESLETLLIKSCDAVDVLPNLSRLHKLKNLKLIYCEKLKDIHELSELEALEELLIDRSPAFDALPNLFRLQKLKRLALRSCAKLKDIHGLSELESLEELLIDTSPALDALPNLSRLQKLKKLKLTFCEKLKDIQGLSELESLEELLIENCRAIDAFPNLSRLKKLKKLELKFCEHLKDIPGLSELESLEELRIQSWHALDALPNLSCLPKLKKLELRFIEKLKDIHGLNELESFEVLLIQRCHSLDVLPMLSRLQKLKKLVLECCVGLKDIQGLCELECLEELTIESFNSLEALPIPFRLKKLKQLSLKSCFRLTDIQGLCEMESLEELLIEFCPSLEALPNLTRLQGLKKVQLRFCRELKDIGGLVMENLEHVDICQCPYLK